MSLTPAELDELAAALTARLRPHPPTEGEAVAAVARKLATLPVVDPNGAPITNHHPNGDPR